MDVSKHNACDMPEDGNKNLPAAEDNTHEEIQMENESYPSMNEAPSHEMLPVGEGQPLGVVGGENRASAEPGEDLPPNEPVQSWPAPALLVQEVVPEEMTVLEEDPLDEFATEIAELSPPEAPPDKVVEASLAELAEEEEIKLADVEAPLDEFATEIAELLPPEAPPDEVVEASLAELAEERLELAAPEAEALPQETPLPVEEMQLEARAEALAIEAAIGPQPELLPTPPAASSFTFDDVRALVQSELAQTQADLTRMIQAEMSREERKRRQASLVAVQEMTEQVFTTKAESLQREMELLEEEEQLTMTNRERPLRERVEDVDLIKERMVRVQQEMAEHEKSTARRLAETTQLLAELEGHGVVVELRQDLEQQKRAVVEVKQIGEEANRRMGELADKMQEQVRQAVAAVPAAKTGLGLWPILAALLLALAVGVAGIMLPLPTTSAPDTTFAVEMANMYQTAGETEDAIRVLDEAVKAGISDDKTLGRVGQMYYTLKQYSKAIPVLEQASRQNPTRQQYRLTLARCYANMGKHQDAINQYQELIKLNANNQTYYLELGTRYESLKQYDKALEQYQKVVELFPDRWEGHYNQGQVYRLRLMQYDKAADQYLLALNKNPDHYLTMVYYGASLAGQGNYEDAIKQYQAALELSPDSQSAPYYWGEACRGLGEFEEAINWYQRVLELNPSSTIALVGLGNTYLAMNDCANATHQFAQVLQIQPSNPEAQAGLAQCTGQ